MIPQTTLTTLPTLPTLPTLIDMPGKGAMRIKKLLATTGIAALVVIGPGATLRASAVTTTPSATEVVTTDAAAEVSSEAASSDAAPDATHETTKLSESAETCIKNVEESGNAEDCQKAPNPILPPFSEILWGTLAFFLVLGVLAWFALPAMRKAMTARSAKIEGDLASAAKAKTDAEAEGATYRAKIGDAKAEGDKLIEEARAQADATRRDLIARAEADAQDIRTKAAEDSAQQSTRLKGELESHVKRLSVDLAEKVVGANLNRDTNNALVDRYIAELGAK